MAKTKTKTVWYCSNCGADFPRWEGRCPACGEWNTLVEEKVSGKPSKNIGPADAGRSEVRKISDIETTQQERIPLPSKELNRVLGGGLVPGSLVLLGGEPGIGKSTLVLQNILSIKSRKVLYISGEESATQLKLRADRIGRPGDTCYIVCETSLETIFNHIHDVQPGLLILYYFQSISWYDIVYVVGSVSQVR
ncbi:MAG: AAA family ATPase, partial [Muribaculaceae bacterium]|nr:AAA family ATPase [Muribaculaceae bacterium]